MQDMSCEEMSSESTNGAARIHGKPAITDTVDADADAVWDTSCSQALCKPTETSTESDVKSLFRHFSILDSSSASGPVLSLERCMVQGCCGNMVHCPFCDPQQYKPTQPARVRDHLHVSHFQHAVYFAGWMMVKCFHKCRDPDPRGGHYHCPSCTSTLLKRNAFTQHLTSHAKKQGLDPSTVHAPDSKQPAVVHFEGHKILLCREKCAETLSAHYHCPLCRQTSMRLASLTSHMWRCNKRAVAIQKIDESEETTNTAELFSSEMAAAVTHARDVPYLKWHQSVVRNLSDLPLARCLKEACCKGRYHCPLCITSKLKPNYLNHMRQHFVSHWRKGVPFTDYTVLVCYLPCEVPQRASRVRFHYHCPLCGATRRRRETFSQHLVNCDPSKPQPSDAEAIGSRSEDDNEDDDEEDELQKHGGEVQEARVPSVAADQAELQAAELLAGMDLISVQSVGHSHMSLSLKQVEGKWSNSSKVRRIGQHQELHQSPDTVTLEQQSTCVLTENDIATCSQNPPNQREVTLEGNGNCCVERAEEMQIEQSAAGDSCTSCEESEALPPSSVENAAVNKEQEQPSCTQEVDVLTSAEHPHSCQTCKIDIAHSEKESLLHRACQTDVCEGSQHGECAREGHTTAAGVTPFLEVLCKETVHDGPQKMLPEVLPELSSQEAGIICTGVNSAALPLKNAGVPKETERSPGDTSRKEWKASQQVDDVDMSDIQVFGQVTTQVAQSTVSQLKQLGELEASLRAIEELCGVSCQCSGSTVTLSSCLDNLCRAEESLKQIVKRGLQAFLQNSSMSQTSAGSQAIPSGERSCPRKRGRPRGSKNKNTVQSTEDYPFLSKQIKIHGCLSDNRETLASGEAAITPPGGLYTSRTRGKHINFAQLHAGNLSPPPSPPQGVEATILPRQDIDGKKRRGRPRKVLMETESRGEKTFLSQKGSVGRIESAGWMESEAENSGLRTQLCYSAVNLDSASSDILMAQRAQEDKPGHQTHVDAQGGDLDHCQQENGLKKSLCTLITTSLETEDLEGSELLDTSAPLPQDAQYTVKTFRCGSCAETGEKSNQTEGKIDGKNLSGQTLAEDKSCGSLSQNSPLSGWFPGMPRIKRDTYKTRTKGNDFVLIPAIIFVHSKDGTVSDPLGQNNMEEDSDSEAEKVKIENSCQLQKAPGKLASEEMTKGSGGGIAEKFVSSDTCDMINDNVISEKQNAFGSQQADCPNLAESLGKAERRHDTQVVNAAGHLLCPLCSVAASSYSQLCEHLAMQHPSAVPLTCEVCEVVCLTPSALAFHVERRHGPRQYPVSSPSGLVCFCGKVCGSMTSLRWHQSFVHKQTDGRRRGPMKLTCGLCNYKASDSWDMRHHRELHRGRPNACPLCHKILSSEAAVKVHMAAIHSNSKHSCHICSKSFAHIRYLKSHLRRHGGEKRHVCGICGWRFHETNTLRAHLDTHKPREQRTYSFKCPHCPAAYNNRANLRDHLNKHTGDKPHICRLCGKGFAFRSMLTTHHAFVHSSERPHACHLCPKKFKTKMQLQQHMVFHTGASNHTCQKCSRALPTASRLRIHARRCKGSILSKQVLLQPQSSVNIITAGQTINIVRKSNMGQGSRVSVIPSASVHVVGASPRQAQTLTLVPIQQILPGAVGDNQERVVLVSAESQAEALGVAAGGQDILSDNGRINSMQAGIGNPMGQPEGPELAGTSTDNSLNYLQHLSHSGEGCPGSAFVTVSLPGSHSHQAISRECDLGLTEKSSRDVVSTEHRMSDIALTSSQILNIDSGCMSSIADAGQLETQTLVLPSDLLNQDVFIIEGDGSSQLLSLANIQFVSRDERDHHQSEGVGGPALGSKDSHHLGNPVQMAANDNADGVLHASCAGGSLDDVQDDISHSSTVVAGQLPTKEAEEASRVTLFVCSSCNQSFGDLGSAEQHVLLQHGVEMDNT